MLSITEISQLFDNIAKAANKKAEPIICNVVSHERRQTGRSLDVHRACPAIPAQGRAGVRPVFIEP
jgi:hypothetical protein